MVGPCLRQAISARSGCLTSTVGRRRKGNEMTVCKVAGLGVLAALAVSTGMARKAEAAYIVTLSEVGGNVVATGSGSLDLASFTQGAFSTEVAFLNPAYGAIDLGPTTSTGADFYFGAISGPSRLGPGLLASASSGSGPIVAGSEGGSTLLVPNGYASGEHWERAPIPGMARRSPALAYAGNLHMDLGKRATADGFTLDAVAVPRPGSIALLACRGRRDGCRFPESNRHYRLTFLWVSVAPDRTSRIKRKRAGLVLRHPSVPVFNMLVQPQPLHGAGGVLVTALGGEIEPVVGAHQQFGTAAIGRVGMEDGAAVILYEDVCAELSWLSLSTSP